MKISFHGWIISAAALLALTVAYGSIAVAADTAASEGGLASVLASKSDTAGVSSVLSSDTSGEATSSGDSDALCGGDCYSGAPGRFWFQGDYLHWWTRGQKLPPLVSTVTDLNNPNGSLSTVFGDKTVENGGHDGFLIDIGAWLDNEHCWGLEINYFDLGQESNNYDSGFSNGFLNGQPFPIVRPFFDPASGVGVNAVGYPNQYVGRATVRTNDYFQSAGAVLRHSLYACEWTECNHDVNWLDASARTLRVDGLAGYRYMRLSDSVIAQDNEMDINAASPTYLNTFNFIDSYRTRNDFNGGEIGLDATATRGRWTIETIGRMAIGSNRQVAQLFGYERVDASNVGGQILQAGSTNEYTRDRFSIIPQFTINGGYNVTDYLKFTVGYDIMYWSHVARAADQIAVEKTTGLPFGTLSGTPLPAFSWQDNYFWAQGFRVGAEVRY